MGISLDILEWLKNWNNYVVLKFHRSNYCNVISGRSASWEYWDPHRMQRGHSTKPETAGMSWSWHRTLLEISMTNIGQLGHECRFVPTFVRTIWHVNICALHGHGSFVLISMIRIRFFTPLWMVGSVIVLASHQRAPRQLCQNPCSPGFRWGSASQVRWIKTI